jgi:hypothetical protein
VLYAATVRLGILDRLKYVGQEYVEEGMEYCEVTVHIGASDKFLEMKPWCVLARCILTRCMNGIWDPPP